MSASRSVQRAVHLALVTSAVATTPLYAADAQTSADAQISEVIVTGSRIQRPDFQSASPIVSVTEEVFERNATLSVETLLNSLPQFVPSVTNTSNNPSNGGQANVELRGLATTRTLVLLDGRRVVPSNPSGVVDLNLFPPSLIGSVEIITGGASAVYGSDAIAGVVNVKSKDLDGVEFRTNIGQTAESDGREYQLSLSGGMKFAAGRGELAANIAYADREAVLAGARDFTRIAQAYDPVTMTFSPTGSATVEEGSVTVAATPAAINAVFAKYGAAPGAARGTTFGFNTDGTLFSFGANNAPMGVQNFRGTITDSFNDRAFSYNFAPTNYLQLPLERTSAFLRGSFEFSENAELYVQGLGALLTANQQLAPTPAAQLFVPLTNPFVPADLAALAASRSAATRNSPLSLAKRVTELGPRFSNTETDIYQLTTGVRGDIASSSWGFDVYGSYGKVKIDTAQLGSISRTKFEQLTFAPDGGASLCQGGLNPFGLGSISQACADFVRVDAGNTTEVKQTVAEAVINGPVATLPAGQLLTAFGVFYKKDEYAFIADDKLRANTTGAFGLPIRVDVAGFNASANVLGETDSTELYAESLVPILADRPGVKKLDLTLGYRFADFSQVDDPVSSYKAEITYQPPGAFTLRGSYQRAVRAPNIGALFQPAVTNFPGINAPEACSTNSTARSGPNAAAVRSLCLAQGLSPDLIDRYTFNNRQVEGLASGNPDLDEETADTVTGGVIFRSPFDSPWLSNLQVSVDYFRINITDAIQPIPASTFVERCYDPQFNPTFSADNFFCSFFQRDPIRGVIVNALEIQQNIGAISTSGVDIQVDWSIPIGPGRLAVNLLANWLNKYDTQEIPGDAFTERVDTIENSLGSAYPRWKGTFNAEYAIGGWSFGARVRYVNTLTDQAVRTFDLPSITYIDASARYEVPESLMKGLVFRLGVTNLADKEPILYPTFVQSNTDPSTYDVLGRRYSFSAAYSFR
jgi:iron complex outermembrane recepter protein